jgi:hypothetical protein
VPISPPVKTRTALVEDAYFSRHFHHLPELPARLHGVPWQVEYSTLPISALYCPYPTPGDKEAPPNGLMGSVGWLAGSATGRRISDMVAAIKDGIRLVTADLTNPALNKVLDLRDRGILFILSREQPLAFTVSNDAWWVREGVHRTIAIALAGASELEGINLSSVRQAAG